MDETKGAKIGGDLKNILKTTSQLVKIEPVPFHLDRICSESPC